MDTSDEKPKEGGDGDGDDGVVDETKEDKWERLYCEGGKRSNLLKLAEGADLSSSSSSTTSSKDTQIRVISFDLDNTIWKTSEVISSANDALHEYLLSNGIQPKERVEVVMNQLFQNDKRRYIPLLPGDDEEEEEGPESGLQDKSPVLLSQLRKDAIRHCYLQHQHHQQEQQSNTTTITEPTTSSQTDQFIDEAFQTWTNARHNAIPHHLSPHTLSTLSKLRSFRTILPDPLDPTTQRSVPIVIGGITDGNSDPRLVDSLRPYFDFCINAETVGVSKPDSRLYGAAMGLVLQIAPYGLLQDIMSGLPMDEEERMEAVYDRIGGWWVHVGDHFGKDVVAAKGLGMRTVWYRGLIKDKKGEEVGNEYFLEESIRDDFADVTLEQFEDIGFVLEDWHNRVKYQVDEAELVVAEEEEDVLATSTVPISVVKEKEGGVSTTPITTMTEEKDDSVERTQSNEKTKFCVYCGTKLPYVAKFCSSCGERQPELEEKQ